MPRKQNITVQLDSETIRRAKTVAAKRGTSLSRLVAEQIRAAIADDQYEAARRLALELLQRGCQLGGERVKRDLLHER